MTREALIRENEALHGLLAHACEALHEVSERDWVENCLDPQWPARRARDTLAQIKEGVVP